MFVTLLSMNIELCKYIPIFRVSGMTESAIWNFQQYAKYVILIVKCKSLLKLNNRNDLQDDTMKTFSTYRDKFYICGKVVVELV
jgi:hypothetical protein